MGAIGAVVRAAAAVAVWTAGKAKEAVAEGYQQLKPVAAAGLADAQQLFTRMTLDGPSLAGGAVVAGAPGTLTQADANAAIHPDAQPPQAVQAPAVTAAGVPEPGADHWGEQLEGLDQWEAALADAQFRREYSEHLRDRAAADHDREFGDRGHE